MSLNKARSNSDYSRKLLRWFDQHGRKDLPWQKNINPYRVWISEIMLQQTQVKTVIPYYERFMATFPDVRTLAEADEDLVLKHWSGLGYYARARNLHKAAKAIQGGFSGRFPDDLEALQSLSGIGRSTAAAILSIAFGQQQAILDGNVKRVLCRMFAVEGWTGKSAVLKQLWLIAESMVPSTRNADYTQAIMDLGATLCNRSQPRCNECPLSTDCISFQQGNPTAYPEKKPKKTLPMKSVLMLIIKNKKQAILMQKRPPVGVWGGLWCFPQFDNHDAAKQWFEDEFKQELVSNQALPLLKHTFSHYHLLIQTLIIQAEAPIKMAVMETDDSLWYNIDTEFNGGLATPVQQLIKQLKET